jgi:integrase/recombinase XerD
MVVAVRCQILFIITREDCMTPLRRRMTEELQLRGYATRTIMAYLRVVSQLARFYQTSPDRLTEPQIRDYLLHLSTERKVASSTFTQALCGIKFLYEHTLNRHWPVLELARPKHEERLPVVLSRDEVRRVLAAVRSPGYRVCLTLIYACGLRLLEGLRLQVPEIDGERNLVHVRGGKGGKDRLVPIPDAALALLRQYWRMHRDPMWLFPASARARRRAARGDAIPPIHPTTLQRAFGRALKASGIQKRAHVHTLRHSYATHLLEAGVPIVLLQEYLGHSSPSTTAIYTHLTRELRDKAVDPINALMHGL